MSTHHQFIFPRYPHLSPPDWPALEERLLTDRYILELRGDLVPYEDLYNLSIAIASKEANSYLCCSDARNTGDVIQRYKASGYLPDALPVRHNDTIRETFALMAAHGVDLEPYFFSHDEQSNWSSPHYYLGPTARACLDTRARSEYDDHPTSFCLVLLAYDGSKPFVGAGEDLLAPCVPDSDLPLQEMPPFGSYIDFIGAAYEDPAVQWCDPQDGRHYHLFDLDWQFSLALGYRMIRANCLTQDSAESLAQAISRIVDHPMICSNRHL